MSSSLFFLHFLLGFIIGWLRSFPIWSFPYLGMAIILLVAFPLGRLQDTFVPFIGLCGLILLLFGVTREWQPFQYLAGILRTDWTLLSLGLYVLPVFIFSSIDHDEDPVLTLFVIGPSLVLFLAALAAFFCRTKRSRITILMGGMALAFFLRLLVGQWYYILYAFLSAGFVLAPALFDPARGRKPSSQPNDRSS